MVSIYPVDARVYGDIPGLAGDLTCVKPIQGLCDLVPQSGLPIWNVSMVSMLKIGKPGEPKIRMGGNWRRR